MDLGLKGKRALVTGGTSGIGLAIATCFAEEGADVIVASRTNAKIVTSVKEIKAQATGGNVSGVVMDLTDEANVRKAWAGIGHVDILVNNVGGPATGVPLEIPLEEWDKGYRSLIRSVLMMAQLAVPGMKECNWGRILTITSTSAREIMPRLPVSSTFRAGLTALTKELARELGRSGILVNNLLPGPTRTERLAHLETDSPDFFKSMAEKGAMGRIAEPEEVGRVAAFLCSNANTYITGIDMLVDGGYTAAL